MKRTFLPLLCSLSLAAHAAAPAPKGKPAGPKPAPDGARFLFVVDTSASMKLIELATRQTVFDLVFGGVDGYMRTGDTFGVWTYDEQIGAGRYPMKVWDADNLVALASHVTMFVRDQELHGNNRLEELMMKLAVVSRSVTNVNVLIISDGDTRMQGTPVDVEINTAYQLRNKERKAAKKPFITTLVVEGGRIVNGFVTLPGEPMSLPPRPAAAAQVDPAAVPAAKAGLADSASGPSGTNTKPVGKTGSLSGSSTQAAVKVPVTNLASTRTGSGEATAKSVAASESGNLPAEAPSTTAAVLSTNRPKKVMQITTLPSRPDPKPEEPPVAEVSSQVKPEAVSASLSTASSATAVMASNVNSAPSTRSTVAPDATVVAAMVPAKSNNPAENHTGLIAVVAPPPIVVAAREVPPSASNPPAPTPAMTAVQVPVSPGLGAIPTLVIGGILLAMALFLLGIALRRMRREPQTSFITQSMHRR